VKYFYETRGFGFIKTQEDEDIFFMGVDVEDKQKLQPGDVVSFTIEKQGKRRKATNVTKLE
jgi:cold shock CspA family protein